MIMPSIINMTDAIEYLKTIIAPGLYCSSKNLVNGNAEAHMIIVAIAASKLRTCVDICGEFLLIYSAPNALLVINFQITKSIAQKEFLFQKTFDIVVVTCKASKLSVGCEYS